MNTKRQSKALALLTRPQGASVAEVADELDIEERSVHSVLSNLRRSGRYSVTSTAEYRDRIYKVAPLDKGHAP